MDGIIIKSNNAGQRIDKFLVSFFANNPAGKKEYFPHTRAEIIRMVKNKEVLVNSKNTKPSYVLKNRDRVDVKIKNKVKKLVANRHINIKIVYQDENIIVLDKPAGIKVHPSSFSERDTLVNFLVAKLPETEKITDGSFGSELRPGIVHRLDQDTSGVMVVARSQEAFDGLKKLFQGRKVLKKYAALVHGKLENKRGVIEKPLAKSTSYKKQVIAGKKTKTKVRAAVTEYEVVKEYGDYSLVEAVPRTGRTHQIRIHLFALGHPIVGDAKYALKKFAKKKIADRHLLHARRLEFKLGAEKFSFRSELADDFRKILASLD